MLRLSRYIMSSCYYSPLGGKSTPNPEEFSELKKFINASNCSLSTAKSISVACGYLAPMDSRYKEIQSYFDTIVAIHEDLLSPKNDVFMGVKIGCPPNLAGFPFSQ